ncbi:hypothetical protein BSNK01_17650 [Bacillaceae bacterium]
MEELKQMFRAILERVEENSAKLDSLIEQVASLDRRVGALEERVGALEERVGALEEEVKKQGRLIEYLAVRYVEHDAAIKELQQIK